MDNTLIPDKIKVCLYKGEALMVRKWTKYCSGISLSSRKELHGIMEEQDSEKMGFCSELSCLFSETITVSIIHYSVCNLSAPIRIIMSKVTYLRLHLN